MNDVTIKCPRCNGQVRAIQHENGESEIQHTKPLCASFERIKTIDDASDLLEEARETLQRELGLPVTPEMGEA